ncbi:MAG: 3-hydroxyacyl-CoA dehydrogenase NAD-binding domain-containing protein [Sphingobium sp.]|uniref:3-hydroxyacyl-CoA dehydrogenase n=1 Tax=Sphingobium sp. TaxID=1912891 RepID=UPI0029A22285|nr:3-hydroxyacyl-CoA dehydrogenase NAD-binding domain-containing protein [Sphingobium sp.]MDX3911566.1 3-hydroxyacyl-CoA dehydrogenase NAD-binding domain-containing protein [Sphingobium sp.]
MAMLSGALTYDVLADCDLLIEAVFEDLELKKQVCAKLGSLAREGAVIATNTSTLDVDVLAQASGKPSAMVGMHFFSPANVMKLLEVVRGAKTDSAVLASVLDLAGRIGKVPVVSGVCYGFIGNRMAEVYMREAEFLLLEGATPAQIDGAIEAMGMAMGPCRMLDMAGVDVGAKTVIEWKKSGQGPRDPTYRAIVDELYKVGRHGQKAGAGYYEYDGRTPIPDPKVERLVRLLAERSGIEQRSNIEASEIVERLLYPLVNEGCKILEEGIAYRPGDIDVVWTFGYGFPKHTGGPMFWAETMGLSRIVERMRHYSEVRGNDYGYWTVSPLLEKAAASATSLAEHLPASQPLTSQDS